MNCELIFYLARRTGENQDALAGVLSRIGLRVTTVAFATNESELCYALAQAVDNSNLIFVVGGLCTTASQHVNTVLSRALSIPLKEDAGEEPVLKGAGVLYNTDGANGYVLESGRQAIVLLPDVAPHIRTLTEGSLLHYLCRKYGLSMRRQLAFPQKFLPLEVPDGPGVEEEDAPPSVPVDIAQDGGQIRRGIPLGGKIVLLLAAVAAVAGGLYLMHNTLHWF